MTTLLEKNIRFHCVIKAEPFLKWAGGKGQLLKQYESFFPHKFNNYIEPFVGGGAIFFHLYNTSRLRHSEKVILLDSNEELVNCYLSIKKNVNKIIRLLQRPKFTNDRESFYKIRAEESKEDSEKATRIIYLNKTCFNGLYRVNSEGKFNVPFGGYVNPKICDSDNLEAVSIALKNVDIYYEDFEKCLDYASRGDFIYLDPPYQPLNGTSKFTSYTKNPFKESDQKRLSEIFRKLDKIGCKVMLSNSDTVLIRNLYKNHRIEIVFAKRNISCKANGRGKISELLILNY